MDGLLRLLIFEGAYSMHMNRRGCPIPTRAAHIDRGEKVLPMGNAVAVVVR